MRAASLPEDFKSFATLSKLKVYKRVYIASTHVRGSSQKGLKVSSAGHSELVTSSGSNKGHDTVNLQYSCGPVGCHLRRKVVEFAVSHETHNSDFLLRDYGCVHFVSNAFNTLRFPKLFQRFQRAIRAGGNCPKLLLELHVRAFCSHLCELTLNQ
jgi:hypothetical protein